ncbi:MAG: hypothetical protein U0176_06340 [Bacteroidia bacterium]
MEKSSKLHRLLSTCTGYELRRFKVFLESPYFNLRPEILRIWDLLRPYFPNSEEPLPEAAAVHAAAYPGQAFDAARLRHLLSELTKLVEEFWCMQQLQQRPDIQDAQLLHVLDARHLDQDFDSAMQAAQSRLLGELQRGPEYLRQRLDLALLQHDHEANRSNRGAQPGLNAALEALDEDYFTQKLRLGAAAVNRANVLGGQAEVPMLHEVAQHLAEAPSVVYEGSLAEAYRLALRTLSPTPDEAAHRQLLELLQDAEGRFPALQMSELYTYALNFCVRMLNQGEPGYDAELFRLYAICLERGYLSEDGLLPVPHYKNFVTLGLRLSRTDLVAGQIESLAQQLSEEVRIHALTFSKAALAFHQGDFKTCLKLLQKIEFVDVYYHLDAKSLLLKAYFEQGETEPLISLIESFKIYLRRSRKISDYQRQTYRNQIRIVQMLVRYRLGSRTGLGEIEAALESLRPIADLAWLERKVQEAE